MRKICLAFFASGGSARAYAGAGMKVPLSID
jgi:hypothetical protein